MLAAKLEALGAAFEAGVGVSVVAYVVAFGELRASSGGIMAGAGYALAERVAAALRAVFELGFAHAGVVGFAYVGTACDCAAR